MGYSGFTEYLCAKGHYSAHDVWGDEPPLCGCGQPFRFSHGVDQTNGYDEAHSATCCAPKIQVGTEDEWRTDPYCNRYAEVIPLFAPGGDGIWIRINSKGQATPPYPDDLASGMSTGTAKTPKAVEGRSPASPVPEGETPNGGRSGE